MRTQKGQIQPRAKHSNTGLTEGSRNELPIIQQGESLLVDAQLLHKGLRSKGRYADWISYRIREYGFEDGRDYYSEKVRKIGSGRPETSYHLTLDMAKELAMLERSDLGRNIRRYFIQKEKEARKPAINFNPLQEFRVAHYFTGLKPFKINDQKLWPYTELIRRIGYSTRGSSSLRRKNYAQHFMKVGDTLYITEDFALHLAHSRAVYVNREKMKQAQSLLPLNFGETIGLLGQEGGAS